ncbi:hypothetical protein MAR_018447 [Mya arenaria]|uniref:Uncharacterized protein n=1 Tax=Mya arenaria TaxID=6604 RepID=A0ABY7EH51_MYAAR|nr:hypothetical protein MAR_018447 [Mya arenaria]
MAIDEVNTSSEYSSQVSITSVPSPHVWHRQHQMYSERKERLTNLFDVSFSVSYLKQTLLDDTPGQILGSWSGSFFCNVHCHQARPFLPGEIQRQNSGSLIENMGNCFRKKSNKVAPDPSQSNDDVSVIISSNTQFRPSPTAVRYGDMEEELKKGEEMVSYLDRGQDAKVAISGVAFDVTFDDKPSNLAVTPRRLPPLQTKGSSNAVSSGPAKKKTRKTTRQSEASQSDDVVIYTASEKELIAGILHDDFINERKQRARKLQNWKLARKAEDERTDEQHDDRTDASAVEEDTKSEDQLIAEIMREDFLAERKARARRCQTRRCNQDNMSGMPPPEDARQDNG